MNWPRSDGNQLFNSNRSNRPKTWKRVTNDTSPSVFLLMPEETKRNTKQTTYISKKDRDKADNRKEQADV